VLWSMGHTGRKNSIIHVRMVMMMMTIVFTVEAPFSGHPLDSKKVSVIGTGRLRECKTSKFVWELKNRVL